MIIDILTIFPNMLDAYIQESIIKRALIDEKIEINVINIRNFSKLKHHQVDDTEEVGRNVAYVSPFMMQLTL